MSLLKQIENEGHLRVCVTTAVRWRMGNVRLGDAGAPERNLKAGNHTACNRNKGAAKEHFTVFLKRDRLRNEAGATSPARPSQSVKLQG